MTWKPALYRSVQIVSWLLAAMIGLMLLAIVIDYLRDGRVLEASIEPPNAGWKVLASALAWSVPTVSWLWIIHLRSVRRWFLGDRTGG